MKMLGCLMAVAGIFLAETSSAQLGRTTEATYEDVINDCLAEPRANLIDCARIAVGESAGPGFSITHEIKIGKEGSVAPREKVIVCPKGDRETCEKFECWEDEGFQQSICISGGYCLKNPYFLQDLKC